ncbi:MAG TPA: hypothetical protein VGE06_13675, partial [Flavisolibacter sp.]
GYLALMALCCCISGVSAGFVLLIAIAAKIAAAVLIRPLFYPRGNGAYICGDLLLPVSREGGKYPWKFSFPPFRLPG